MAQFSPAMWVISPEEKSKTEVIFNSLKPNNGKLSGEQAKKYLMLSNLPSPVLGHIWQLSDIDKDGKMTQQEFTIAVHLIQAKCRGIEVPKVLPYSLKSSSTPNQSVFGSSANPTPAPMLTPMNNGAIGTPMISSGGFSGMPPGGMLTPMSYGATPGGPQAMPSSFTAQGNQSGFGTGFSAFSNQGNPPGFHTGISGSSTFPRNLHQAQSGTSYSSGMSSLDSLGLISNSAWNRPDASFQQKPTVSRAATLPVHGATPSSMSSLSGLQFGTPTPAQPVGMVGIMGARDPTKMTSSSGTIPPANRLKYTQMFKAADHEKNGFIKGEQARQLLIQSSVAPDKLAKIWDLSDINKDGNLDLDEFVIAMHLIDLAKSGQPVPVTLPPELIPPTKKFSEPEPLIPEAADARKRSESVTSLGKYEQVTFEDKRKENYEKGRMELDRRRKEIQERLQKEKEERERKEREEEERKRKIREEAERRKQQQIENERRQREEMEKEQEAMRKKMAEQRLAAQLEMERQRQREWEQRRKEELLNQKGMEEDIVTGLKLRLEKLKGELTQETTKRDVINETLQTKKIIFNDLLASTSQMNKSKDFGVSQINQFKNDIQRMKLLVAQLKAERERLDHEINKRDSTTTSEALGGVRASIQQTKSNIPRLKSNVISIEAETDNVLKENDFNTRQIPTVKAALQIKIEENNRFKQSQEQKKREYVAAKQRIEDEARRLDAINRRKREEEERLRKEAEVKRLREEMIRKQKEDERRKQKEKEQHAMRLEQQRQEESMRQKQQAFASEKKNQMEKAKKITAEALKKQQEIKTQNSALPATTLPPSAIQDLFTASSSKADKSKDFPVLPIPPPKKGGGRPVAPPRPKTRPVVASTDKIKIAPPPDTKKEEPAGFGNWDLLADLDRSMKKPEEDMMAQLKQKTEEQERKRQAEEEKKRQEETRKQQEEEEQRKKEVARKKLIEDKRKKEEDLQRRKEEEKRKGETEKRRWEDELKRKEQEKLDKERKRQEEERKKGEMERKRWEQEVAERQRKEEEERKVKEKEDIKKKVEELQRLKKMKKQQQEQQIEPQKAVEVQSEYEAPTAAPTSTKPKSRYKTLFPFEARHPDELTLFEGDIVQVEEDATNAPPGWRRGTCGGKSGLFPENYAEKLPKDTFSDYVDLDKNAAISQNPPLPQQTAQVAPKLQKPTIQVKPQAPQNAEIPKESLPPQKKTALVPKNIPLQKPSESSAPVPIPKPSALKPRKGSLLESVVEHERTSSFGSSDGTDGSSSQHGSVTSSSQHGSVTSSGQQGSTTQGSVKSMASSFDRRECYENVQPPVSIEGPSVTETAVKAPEGLQAFALYPYRGKKDDHLSFNKNDQIIVQEQQDMWWYGECSGKTGWFPKSYVKIIGTVRSPICSIPDDTCDASSVASSTSSVATEHSGGEQNVVAECVALFDYAGIDGDLTFNEGDVIKITKKEGDWWEGMIRGETGFFPANYVTVKEQQETPKKPEVATVISVFTASDPREISLSPGQLIHVLKKDQGGWWQGELQARGKKRQVGWFPANHVKSLVKSVESSKPAEQAVADVDDDIYAVPQKRENPADQVLALFSYTAVNEDELTFYKGSVINVIGKEGDWWRGELNGQVGMFPYNYVQLLSDLPDSTAQWEGSFDSAVLNALSKSERQRQHYIHELINTEQVFMDDLSLTLEIFYNPLAEAGVLTEQELNTVFVNWREIIMCNTKLLKALLVRKTMSVDNKIDSVGDILVEQIPRLTPYIRFCSCQLKACKLLQQKVENDAEFKQFEKKCAGDSRLRQNLPLSSYLLKPLQRITKYPLIIKQILRYTSEDHHDRPNLEQALEQIEELCSQINENIRMVESTNRLEWLQSHVNLEGLGEKLVFNSQTNSLGQRKFLHHATLYKHKSNKELRAFLFNDFLLLTRHHGSSPAARTFTSIFQDNVEGEISLTIYKKPIFLNEIVVKLPIDAEVNETLFCLSHIDRIYSLRTETKNERNAWLTKLQKASEHFIETERFQRKRAHRARSVLGQGVGRLTVMIMEGFDLKASDPTGTSDPYCEVSMGSQEHKTKVIPKTLNPKWNSQMIFTVKDIDQDVLCVTVFDRDFFSPNDFLGRTELSISSLLKEGPGPWTKRLLLHEVQTGEIVLRASFQKFEKR